RRSEIRVFAPNNPSDTWGGPLALRVIGTLDQDPASPAVRVLPDTPPADIVEENNMAYVLPHGHDAIDVHVSAPGFKENTFNITEKMAREDSEFNLPVDPLPMYSQGQLYVPSVVVPKFGRYSAILILDAASDPLVFTVDNNSIKPAWGRLSDTENEAHFDPKTKTIMLPRVDVLSANRRTLLYRVIMNMISANPMRFGLD
ncbi:MAG: hypothetical protein GY862_38730, partial [Gammaproteobacteria bacterium]|nr:hypothetical protein [Gammaproteobacteria bacterium]